MARKRSIDPDFWTDEKVQNIPWAAVGFQVGLISFADDDGRLEWSLRQLSARIVGQRDDVTRADIECWMEAIEREGLVHIYEVAGKKYAYHPAWEKHQYINKRTKSKLPPPPISGPSIDADGGSGTVEEDELNAFDAQKEQNHTKPPTDKSRKTTGILPEYDLNTIGTLLELPVPLVSVSVLVSGSDSGSTPAGAGEPRRGERCLCECIKVRDVSYSPEDLADLFLATFANCRSVTSRRARKATWLAWLREMHKAYSWPAVWAAFAQSHRDGDHRPLQGSAAMWANLRANNRPNLTPMPAPELHGYLDRQKCATKRGQEPNGWMSVPPPGMRVAEVWPEHKHLAMDYEPGVA